MEERLRAKQASPRCGLSVIDLRSGDVVYSLRIEGVVQELYDAVVLPQVWRPQAIGIRGDEIRRVMREEDASF